jgi:hypothetical protein
VAGKKLSKIRQVIDRWLQGNFQALARNSLGIC